MARLMAVTTILLAHLGFLVPGETPVPRPRARVAAGEFLHRDHVRTRWSKDGEPEYGRDCAGCHQYNSETATRDPQAVCAECHRNGALTIDQQKTSPAYLNDLDALRKDRPFRHWFHKSYDCKLCHERNKAGPESTGRTGDIKYRPGWHTCIECHDPKGARFAEGGQPDPGRFVKTLNRMLGAQPERTGTEFRHDEHLASTGDHTRCATCHAGILGSKGADIGQVEITPSECSTCHVGEPPAGKVIPGFEETRHDCLLLGAFPHAAHCDEDAASKDPTIKAQGCLACHTVVEGGRTYGLQEKFRTDRYQACEDCHSKLGDEWVLRDASNKPDHGKVDSCSACHEFGVGPMKTHRPHDLVRRPRPSAFGLVSHDHPFITKSDGKYKVDASCKECHRAGFEGGLPSRIGHKKFSHDTHLPATPTPADCDKCHADVATAKDPASLKLYKLDACAECHKGGKITEIFPEEPTAARPVPRFPHELHLTPAARKHPQIASEGCLACHQPAQNGATGVGTVEKALDCSKCHDHGESPELCAGKNRAYVASCAKCHGPDGPSGQPVTDSRLHVASLTGAQWHPMPDKQACAECHLPGASLFRLQGKVHVHAIIGYDQGARDGFHAKFDRDGALKKSKKCTACHWHEIMGAGDFAGDGQTAAEELRDARSLGADLSTYPGGVR